MSKVPAKRVRVLVANRPRLMRELVLATISDQSDIEVIGDLEQTANLAEIVEQARPDVLIIALDSQDRQEKQSECGFLIGRYQGEKKISSMPYTLSIVTGRGGANLRMGTKVPVTMSITNLAKDAPTGGTIQYQDVGTNIDCGANALDDGRFSLNLSIDDSSVYPDDQATSRGTPSFRSFRATNAMVLRSGETGQFTTATDKITGETVKVDVTLTVVK